MTKQPRFINADRRRFIQKTSVVGGAAVAGAAVLNAQADSGDDTTDVLTERVSEHAGYQLTDRVKEYYRKARF